MICLGHSVPVRQSVFPSANGLFSMHVAPFPLFYFEVGYIGISPPYFPTLTGRRISAPHDSDMVKNGISLDREDIRFGGITAPLKSVRNFPISPTKAVSKFLESFDSFPILEFWLCSHGW